MKPLITSIASILISATALADTQVYKDWSLQKAAADEIFQKEACIASTNVTKGTHTAEVILSFTTDKATVPQLLVKVWGQTAPEDKLLIKVSSKVTYPLFLWKAAAKAADANIYWYAPIGWTPLRDYIAAANQLTIQGAETSVNFSLKGSSITLDRTEKCLGVRDLLPTDFLKKINAKTATQTPIFSTIDEMIAGNEQTFADYRLGSEKTAAVNALRKTATKLLSQEKVALEELAATQRRLDRAQAALNEALARQSSEQASLAQSQTTLKEKTTDLVSQQEFAAQKKAVYDPVYQQILPLQREVNNRAAAVDNKETEIASIQRQISSMEYEISSLQSEEWNLSSRIGFLKSTVSSAEWTYDRARREDNNFNVDHEYRRELSSNGRYSSAQQDMRSAESAVRTQESVVSRLRSDVVDAEVQLRSCELTPEADCSSQKQNVSIRKQVLNDQERALNSERQRFERSRNEVSNIERQTSQRVNSRKEDLRRQAQYARNELNDAIHKLNDAENRLSSIRSTIPSLQSNLSYAKNNLSSAQSQLRSLKSSYSQAIKNRDALKESLNYKQIEAEYFAARDQVSATQKEIASLNSRIKDLQAALKKSASEIFTLQKDLITRQSNHAKSEAKLAPIQAQLKPMRDQEAVIVAEIDALAASFEDGKARYQRSYEQWLQSTTVIPAMSEVIGTF